MLQLIEVKALDVFRSLVLSNPVTNTLIKQSKILNFNKAAKNSNRTVANISTVRKLAYNTQNSK